MPDSGEEEAIMRDDMNPTNRHLQTTPDNPFFAIKVGDVIKLRGPAGGSHIVEVGHAGLLSTFVRMRPGGSLISLQQLYDNGWQFVGPVCNG
jgi:hypothetical protein